jgi:hypothetical protein
VPRGSIEVALPLALYRASCGTVKPAIMQSRSTEQLRYYRVALSQSCRTIGKSLKRITAKHKFKGAEALVLQEVEVFALPQKSILRYRGKVPSRVSIAILGASESLY